MTLVAALATALTLTMVPARSIGRPILRCSAYGVYHTFPDGSLHYPAGELKLNVKGKCWNGYTLQYTVAAFGRGSYCKRANIGGACDEWVLKPTVTLHPVFTYHDTVMEQTWTSEYFVSGTVFAITAPSKRNASFPRSIGGGGITLGDSCGANCYNVKLKFAFSLP